MSGSDITFVIRDRSKIMKKMITADKILLKGNEQDLVRFMFRKDRKQNQSEAADPF